MAASVGANPFDRAIDLLGGELHLGRRITSLMDVHTLILEGMPCGAVTHLFKGFDPLRMTQSMEDAVGFSVPAFLRRRKLSQRPLTCEQGGKIWQFAVILALATDMLGSQNAAQQWLEEPVMALDRNRPTALLATPAGTDVVSDLLGRLQHGVYT